MGSAWLGCPIHPPKTCALPEHRQPPDRISNDAKKLARILSDEQHNTTGGRRVVWPDVLNFEIPPSRPQQELNITCDLTTTGWVTPPSSASATRSFPLYYISCLTHRHILGNIFLLHTLHWKAHFKATICPSIDHKCFEVSWNVLKMDNLLLDCINVYKDMH